MHKLGVIVPFRDRYEHLVEFKSKIVEYLNKQNIQYELIIIEQDDAKLFNRGKLLNIGFNSTRAAIRKAINSPPNWATCLSQGINASFDALVLSSEFRCFTARS